MANIGVVLKQEISRLSRREIRRETATVKSATVRHRHEIAALKRQVAQLEKTATQLAKRASAPSQAPTEAADAKPMRFVAKGLRSLRTRLGLSAPGLAALLGASPQSVYNWETKKAVPGKEFLSALAALRGVGKREAQERLQATTAPAKKRTRKAARKGRRRRAA